VSHRPAGRRARLARIAPSLLATLGFVAIPTCDECLGRLPPEEQKAVRAACVWVGGILAAGSVLFPLVPGENCDFSGIAEGLDGRSELKIRHGIGSVTAVCSMRPAGDAPASCDAQLELDLAPTAVVPQHFDVYVWTTSVAATVQATVDCGNGAVGPDDGPTSVYAGVGQQGDCVVDLQIAATEAVVQSYGIARVDFRLARGDGDGDGVTMGDACPSSPALPVGPEGCASYGQLTHGRVHACDVPADCQFTPVAGECSRCNIKRPPMAPGDLEEICYCGSDCTCVANVDGSIETHNGVHALGDLAVDCRGAGAWATAQPRVVGCYWAPPGGGRTWNATGRATRPATSWCPPTRRPSRAKVRSWRSARSPATARATGPSASRSPRSTARTARSSPLPRSPR
jgi:hypothetical protein